MTYKNQSIHRETFIIVNLPTTKSTLTGLGGGGGGTPAPPFEKPTANRLNGEGAYLLEVFFKDGLFNVGLFHYSK